MITAIATPTPERPESSQSQAGTPETTIKVQPLSAKRIPLVPMPVEQCAWCWYNLYPGKPYPESWSSTICVGHSAWILLQAAARRAMRGKAQ